MSMSYPLSETIVVVKRLKYKLRNAFLRDYPICRVIRYSALAKKEEHRSNRVEPRLGVSMRTFFYWREKYD